MFRAGQQIGIYTLLKVLGQGGFGEVWLAENHNNSPSEQVAIKLPRNDQIDLQAVKEEIFNWILSGKHKNILPIIECETFGNQIAIVSEFAPDGSLQNLLNKQGSLSVADAVEIIIGILDGLAHLHNRKIIHRDLKPDNVLFQGKIPRLTDFGISRAMPIDSQSDTVTGTFSYMSPEAFDGKRNAQTDIWSVGVILYQLLSGKLPFPQKTQVELVGALVMKEPAPLPDSVPPVLQYIVKKSLAKEPSERYQTADEMREDLRNALSPQKFVEKQTSSQAETLVLEGSDKTAKLEIAQVQEATPIIEDNERETELQSVQTEIKTPVKSQPLFISEVGHRQKSDFVKDDLEKVTKKIFYSVIQNPEITEDDRTRLANTNDWNQVAEPEQIQLEALQNPQPIFVKNITEARSNIDKSFDEIDFKQFLRDENTYIKSKKSKLWFRTISDRKFAKVFMLIGFISSIIVATIIVLANDSTNTFIGFLGTILGILSIIGFPGGLYLYFIDYSTCIDFDSKTIKSDFLGNFSNEREKFSSEQIEKASLLIFESSKYFQIVFGIWVGYSYKKCLLYEVKRNSMTKNDLIETCDFFKFVFTKLGIEIFETETYKGNWKPTFVDIFRS